MGNGIIYGYLLNPEEDRLFGDIFNKLMGYEMFKYLKKMYPLADHCSISDAVAGSGCLKLVQLSPKSDVSLALLDDVYRALWKKICSAECSPELLEKIANREAVTRRVRFTDLGKVYETLLAACLKGVDVNNSPSTKIKNANPKEIKSFLEEVFHRRKVFWITTKFRADDQ
jgi:hypothetical protein